MPIRSRHYSPKNPWSRRRYSRRAKAELWLTQAYEALYGNVPSLARVLAPHQLFGLQAHFSYNRVVTKPRETEIALLAIHMFWIVPVEKVEKLKRGLLSFRRDVPSTRFGRSMSDEDFLDVFAKALRIDRAGWAALGSFKLEGIGEIALSLTHQLSSFVIVSAHLEPNEEWAGKLAHILNAAHGEEFRIIWTKSIPGLRGGSQSTPAEFNKAQDVEDLVLDLKWRIHSRISSYCGIDTFLPVGPMPSIELYTVNSVPPWADMTQEQRSFWRSMNDGVGPWFHFVAEGGGYFCSYPPLSQDDRVLDRSLRMFVDVSKMDVGGNQDHGKPDRLLIEHLRHWDSFIGSLVILDALSDYLTVESSRLRARTFSNLARKKLSNLLATQRSINRINQILLRIRPDSDIPAERQRHGFPDLKSSLDHGPSLTSWIRDSILGRLQEARTEVDILQSAFKQELELRLLVSSRKWQWLTFLVAIISVWAALIALVPDATRKAWVDSLTHSFAVPSRSP